MQYYYKWKTLKNEKKNHLPLINSKITLKYKKY